MNYIIYNENCLDAMKRLEDNSVDSIVTDPPYGLSFMGKKWDYDVPSTEIWSECLRVLKPGGHLLAFAGTRTQHRMAVRIEDAGFEIRDMIFWCYGSGFPKSHDVSKAIDKAAGRIGHATNSIKDILRKAHKSSGRTLAQLNEICGFEASGYLRDSSTWASVLPPQDKWPVIRDALGLHTELDSLFEEAEREVVGYQKRGNSVNTDFMSGGNDITSPATEAAKQWQGWGTALKPALEPVTVARKPLIGTVAENVLTYGTGALNIDGCRVGTSPEQRTRNNNSRNVASSINMTPESISIPAAASRWPANLIHDGSDEVVGLFPVTKSGALNAGHKQGVGSFGKIGGETILRDYGGDKGSAARFFYCARQDVSTPEVGYNEAWQDQNQNQSSALTAGQNLSLLKAVGGIVQKAVATWQSLEGILSNAQSGAFTSVTQSELKTISEVATATIASIGSGFLLAQQLEKLTPCGSRVKCAAMKEPTGITTITTSLCKSDGCVAVVTSTITQTNLELGVSASRFNYCAKASKRDRDEGLEGFARKAPAVESAHSVVCAKCNRQRVNVSGACKCDALEWIRVQQTPRANHHPTVKPTDLMRYLCRLVTPPGGVVLDPFTGSGSTGKAAMLEGFSFIGCELSEEYAAIANARIEAALNQKHTSEDEKQGTLL